MKTAQIRAEALPLGGGRYRSRVQARGTLLPRPAAAKKVLAQADETPLVADDDGDLLTRRFRFFSADTDLAGHYMRSPGTEALTSAAEQWGGLLVRADHTRSVEALVGQTLPDAAYVEGEPGGVEGTIEFDRQLNATIARGVERGILTAVSSVVDLTWEQSHPDMDEDRFWALLGEEYDGRQVTRQALEILAVDGVDVVDVGADPHAVALRRGDVPDTASHKETGTMLTHLRTRLGLAATATEAEITAKLELALAIPAETVAWADTGRQLRVLMQMPTATAADLQTAAIALITQAAKLPALEAELVALRAKLPNAVDVALSEGRITPAQVEQLKALHQAAPEGTELYLASLPENGAVPLGRQTSDSSAPAGAVGGVAISAEALAAAKRHGLEAGDVQAEMDRRRTPTRTHL